MLMIKKSFADFLPEITFLGTDELKVFSVKMCCQGVHSHLAIFFREDFAKDYCNYLNSKKKSLVPHSYYVSTYLITDLGHAVH